MGKLTGQVALITGASRGIGAATAERLAAEGASIVLNYYSGADTTFNEKAADQVSASVRKLGVDVLRYDANVSNKEQVHAMVEAAKAKFGCIDILVNNAGVFDDKEITKQTDESWDRVVGVNLKGQFLVTRAVVPIMISRKSGKIVNVASELGLKGEANASTYCATKAGVIGFTKALARELAPYGILVNCVAPGPVETDMLDADERNESAIKRIPLGRNGRPEEIAAAIYFLVSPDTTWTTGQVLSPNGGIVI